MSTHVETRLADLGRGRMVPAAAAAVTVAAGLGGRIVVAGDVAKYAGDALYTVLLFWIVVLVTPHVSAARAGMVALGVSVAVELFQLTGVPAALAEHSVLAHLVLGTTFNAPDLFWYAVGALVAGLAWWGATRHRAV